MFDKLLSALGLQPKSLDQARGTLESAKVFAESVNALFTSAGLNLEQMLAAGPDALKAHIESIGSADESMADALLENERLQTELDAATAKAAALAETFKAVGFEVAEGADAKAEFAEHVKKASALELAKAGHPPVAHVPTNAIGVTQSDQDLFAQYKAMKGGSAERDAFFASNRDAILRAAGMQN